MISHFTATINDTEFRFHTVNVKRLQLFQVYVMHEGKKVRFHVQRKGEGEFYITDKEHCPEPYRGLEPEFNKAIFDYGKTVGAS
jgi:hypothetical protein